MSESAYIKRATKLLLENSKQNHFYYVHYEVYLHHTPAGKFPRDVVVHHRDLISPLWSGLADSFPHGCSYIWTFRLPEPPAFISKPSIDSRTNSFGACYFESSFRFYQWTSCNCILPCSSFISAKLINERLLVQASGKRANIKRNYWHLLRICRCIDFHSHDTRDCAFKIKISLLKRCSVNQCRAVPPALNACNAVVIPKYNQFS